MPRKSLIKIAANAARAERQNRTPNSQKFLGSELEELMRQDQDDHEEYNDDDILELPPPGEIPLRRCSTAAQNSQTRAPNVCIDKVSQALKPIHTLLISRFQLWNQSAKGGALCKYVPIPLNQGSL